MQDDDDDDDDEADDGGRLYFLTGRPGEDLHPGRRVSDGVGAVPAAESVGRRVPPPEAQAQAQAEDHQPEQRGGAADPRGPPVGALP